MATLITLGFKDNDSVNEALAGYARELGVHFSRDLETCQMTADAAHQVAGDDNADDFEFLIGQYLLDKPTQDFADGIGLVSVHIDQDGAIHEYTF